LKEDRLLIEGALLTTLEEREVKTLREGAWAEPSWIRENPRCKPGAFLPEARKPFGGSRLKSGKRGCLSQKEDNLPI